MANAYAHPDLELAFWHDPEAPTQQTSLYVWTTRKPFGAEFILIRTNRGMKLEADTEEIRGLDNQRLSALAVRLRAAGVKAVHGKEDYLKVTFDHVLSSSDLDLAIGQIADALQLYFAAVNPKVRRPEDLHKNFHDEWTRMKMTDVFDNG